MPDAHVNLARRRPSYPPPEPEAWDKNFDRQIIDLMWQTGIRSWKKTKIGRFQCISPNWVGSPPVASVTSQKLHNPSHNPAFRADSSESVTCGAPMATRRIAQSAINWAALAERVPPHQKSQFQAFKAKSDQYLRNVLANPEKAPEINWAFYKSKVPVAGMVDDFQKQYSALKVPYPPDTVSPQIDAQEKELQSEIARFKAESNSRIDEFKKELDHLNSLIPFDQMTMEDFRDAFPEQAMDSINKPTFWPHTPEEQVGYEDDKQVATAH